MKKNVLLSMMLSIVSGCVDTNKNEVPGEVSYERGVADRNFPIIVEGFAGTACENGARLSADGKILSIDGSKSGRDFVWRRYALATKPGLLAATNRYALSFDAKVQGLDENSFLYVLVRPRTASSDRLDAGTVAVRPVTNGWQHVELPFSVNTNMDYCVQIHSRNRIKAEIRNFTLRWNPPMMFTPIAGTQEKWTALVPDVPKGAKEFDVNLPRAGTGLVLDAAAFGVSESNSDNTAALAAALAAAKERKASRLEIRKGFYRFTSNASITLEGMTDFTFDAKGSTFQSLRRRCEFMEILNCKRTRVMNFKLDWNWTKDPLASLVKVTKIAENSFDLTFVDYSEFPRRDMRLAIISAFDPKTRSVGVEDGVTRGFEFRRGLNKKTNYTWAAPNVVRVNETPGRLAVGQLYRLQHYYYDMNGFGLDGNEHLRLENIDVLSTPGHAFRINGTQKYTLFDHVNIVAPKDDPRRVITCTADHLHVSRSCGFIKMQNCEFSLGADDIFNMHDNSGFARKIGKRTVRTRNARAMAHAKIGSTIELRHGDYSPTGFFGKLVGRKAINAKKAVFDLTFDQDIPDQKTDGFVLFDWTYDTHNVIVRNCFFHDNRARGILILARDVTIENNVFRHHEKGAIKIETGYTFNVWSEGYGVSNVVIRGNLFDNVNPSGSFGGHRQRSVYTGIYLRTDPSPDTTDYPIIRDILFEGNTFRDSCGVIGYLTSVKNIIFRDNIFDDPTPRKKELAYRAQFYLSNARDVKILNNTYIASPNVKAPGVEWDPLTCERVLIQGNCVKTK